jgi:hypothetical protein
VHTHVLNMLAQVVDLPPVVDSLQVLTGCSDCRLSLPFEEREQIYFADTS